MQGKWLEEGIGVCCERDGEEERDGLQDVGVEGLQELGAERLFCTLRGFMRWVLRGFKRWLCTFRGLNSWVLRGFFFWVQRGGCGWVMIRKMHVTILKKKVKVNVCWSVEGCRGAVMDGRVLVVVARTRRQRVGPHVSVDLNQNIEYIPEQPQWTRYRDPTPPSPPPSVDEYSPGQTQSVPSAPSGGTSSSRGSKRKAPMVDSIDSQFDKLTTSLDGFANVLSSSNVHFGVISDAAVRQVSTMEDRNQILRSQTEILRRTPNYTYTEADIYEMLSAMNISDENLLEQCYDFLCRNPTCTKRLMGLPPHKRWNKLCKMISGGDC
ncbi:uncharacterized protein HKW66_Vig0105550 [Vigna angularis]|uniref:Uncharacterized protein n=1 Tax=Phaseolus angularis TaxID=3914 RepID=A0A8T0KKN7_PHAAN|nr:uncharacterized protein HKW66_Vig0105550 [Vigna angularis]